MAKVLITDSLLTGIANAIRAKTGGSGTMTPAQMATEIGNISSGGISGIATGEFTLQTAVDTDINYKITDTAEIGFTPTKFIFYRTTDTTTDSAVYNAEFYNIGGKYTRNRSLYVARDSVARSTGVVTNWTSIHTGYLYFNSNNVYFNASSGHILETGTYKWIAIA